MKPEREVEIRLWDWLMNRNHGNIKEVFFNSKNELGCKIFKVKGSKRKIPDIVLKVNHPHTGAINYIAIEVKDGRLSGGVRSGDKIGSEYLLNYIEGKTKYFIEDEEIKIDHFALATQFSEEGRLIRGDNLEFNEGVRGKKNIGGSIVPFYEFSGTKNIYRMLLSSFAKYRKDNEVRTKLPSLGIFISDVLLNFDIDELKIQQGMKGLPVYQAITFNELKSRWSQCLMRL